MSNIFNTALAITLATLGAGFILTWTAPQITTAAYHTPPHRPAISVGLGSRSEEPASDELRVPEALVNALLTEERFSETMDLRVPRALLVHLYDVGRVWRPEKSPAP
jgi:hypothetical protein